MLDTLVGGASVALTSKVPVSAGGGAGVGAGAGGGAGVGSL